MNKALPFLIMVALFSCKNGNTESTKSKQERTYTEKELQDSISVAVDQRIKHDRKIDKILHGSQETTPQSTTVDIPPTPKTYYVFAAINFSFSHYTSRQNAVYVSEIVDYHYKPSKDEEYMILDKASTSSEIRYKTDVAYDKRKVYSFTTYAGASEKRQEILKNGIN